MLGGRKALASPKHSGRAVFFKHLPRVRLFVHIETCLRRGIMKTALVVGMAKSGIASARLLKQHGYNVILNDSKSEIPSLEDALPSEEGYFYELGKDPVSIMDGVDIMVMSPGVSMFLPFVDEARRRGIEVIGEIELGYRYSKGDFYCITGTNGKTTSTALLGEIFKTAKRRTHVLGNIGTPITSMTDEMNEGDTIVAETAALQLEGNIEFHAKGAAFCNLTEDHLDRFLTMENYLAAKCKIFDNQTKDDVAVLNFDDPIVSKLGEKTKAKVLFFSRKQEVEGVYCLDDKHIYSNIDGEKKLLCMREDLRIIGTHNLENAMMCAAMALFAGVSGHDIKETFATFGGVEHRIEFVCNKNGISYINDSKGTNPDSTIKAIAAMDSPSILLLGGYDKHSEFDELFQAMNDEIKGIVALGNTAKKIIDAAKNNGYKGIIEHEEGDFKAAVERARDMAKPGYTVLLSPACASWDMFDNFEQRGEVFKQIVREF